MKSLRQLMEETYRQKYIDLEIAGKEDDVDLDLDPALKAVVQWLGEKKNHLTPHCESQGCLTFYNGALSTFSELISDLSVQKDGVDSK